MDPSDRAIAAGDAFSGNPPNASLACFPALDLRTREFAFDEIFVGALGRLSNFTGHCGKISQIGRFACETDLPCCRIAKVSSPPS